MTTGTEGPDNLTNDGTQTLETIDALGGDDVITVNRPTQPFSDRNIIVNGGDGFDTLIINANNYTISENQGFQGSLRIREGSGINWTVHWTSIERLELNNGRFFNSNISLGDEIDIIRMTPGFGGRIDTNGGNDEIYFTGTGQDGPVVAAGGAGNDLIDLSGLQYFGSAGSSHEAIGGDGNDVLRGSGYRDRLDGGAGDDTLFVHYVHPSLPDSSVLFDTALGGEGNDLIYFGTALSAYDVADGGAGRDAVILQGNVTAVLSQTNLVGIESISLQTGANAEYGDTANNRYDYNLTTADGNVGAGQQLIVNGQSLLAGEDFTFNGSAETDGKFLVFGGHGVENLTGGDGNDIFFFEGQRWTVGDKVDGGDGRDALVISAGTGFNRIEFAADALTGIESISLNNKFATDQTQNPNYSILLDNGNVAPGATLIVNGASLTGTSHMMSIDGSHVLNGNLKLFGGGSVDSLTGGAGADTLIGGGSSDLLTGGAGADTFRYDAVSDGSKSDYITDFVTGVDRIDLTRIDANSNVGGDQAFTWIGSNAFSHVAGELRIYLDNGQWRVEGDINGDTIADFGILFQSGTTPPVESDFLL
jgi:Ca2+-binding RTX toxin-like protein